MSTANEKIAGAIVKIVALKKRVRGDSSLDYLDRSPMAGAWSHRFDLLAKRLQGRPQPIVLAALRKLIDEENHVVDEHWIVLTSQFISEGRAVSAD